MKLTSYFDYSLRVLIYLGRRPGKLATIGEIAGYFNISRNHLIKVVHELGIKGYILTTRGRRGGIARWRAPPARSESETSREKWSRILICSNVSAMQATDAFSALNVQ